MDTKLQEIYRKHGKFVYNTALKTLRNREDAEDVTQYVFMKLLDSPDIFRGESDIKTFLYRMTVNRSIDLIRSESSRRERAEKVFSDKTVHPDTALLIEDALSLLTEEQKIVLILSETAGLKYNEIAKILGISEGTVKSRINRAIRSINEKITKEQKWTAKD